MDITRRHLLSTGFAAMASGGVTVASKNLAESVLYKEPKPLNSSDAKYFALGATIGGAAALINRIM